jgi:hypothetical protein
MFGSFGSEFTTVGGGPSSGVSISEGKDGFGRTGFLLIHLASTDFQPESSENIAFR